MTSMNDTMYVCRHRLWIDSPDDLHAFREYTMDVLVVCAIVIICECLAQGDSYECVLSRCAAVCAPTAIEYRVL
jgi:hypothetical protein